MVCRVRQAVGFLEPAPYREIEQKIRQLETLRTYFLNNSKVCAEYYSGYSINRGSSEVFLYFMEYNSLYPPAFFLHYDMKVE